METARADRPVGNLREPDGRDDGPNAAREDITARRSARQSERPIVAVKRLTLAEPRGLTEDMPM